MKLNLELKQVQKLSPQQIQSIFILQMGLLELQGFVEQLLLDNPTIELESHEQRSERSERLQKLEWLQSTDRQNHCYYQENPNNFLEYASALDDENLYDHLKSQLPDAPIPHSLRIAMDCVMAGLNSNGYLDESDEELSIRCGQPISVVQTAIQMIQDLEPAGIAARSLSECLSIQLKRIGQSGLPLTIAQHHLEDVAKNHYAQIAKRTGASREEIQSACVQIRKLDPRPGARFAHREAPKYIIPDLLIQDENGVPSINLSDDFLPVLRVSGYYKSLLNETDDADVHRYLDEKISQAVHVIKGIEQRRSTLYDCTQVILDRQKSFFTETDGSLHPLTLSDVASALGLHESTISRAIRDKYLQCSRGTFPLSHFFSRSIQTKEAPMSSQQVKNMIQTFIENEDPKHPLSDQKICELLSKKNISISRRTVAKYREELGIASTSGRKQY